MVVDILELCDVEVLGVLLINTTKSQHVMITMTLTLSYDKKMILCNNFLMLAFSFL